jgi:hypothetical protein
MLLVALALCLPVDATAEYYRYETENGSVAFTDDPEQIPTRYRDSAVPLAEQSLHDYERTTRVEPDARRQAAPETDRAIQPQVEAPAETVTLSAGEGMNFDVPANSVEPIRIEKRIMRPHPDGKGTAEYTIVRQGDRVLMEVVEPVLDWIEP